MTSGINGLREVWKYPMEIKERQVVQMPSGARLLACKYQSGVLALWAEVIPSRLKERRVLLIYGTGEPGAGDGGAAYLETVQDGPLVWHIYDGGVE